MFITLYNFGLFLPLIVIILTNITPYLGQDEEDAAASADPCNDNPCGEKGVCRDLGNNFAYACQCDRGWTDDDNFQLPNCKKLDDSTCHDDMCEHGGRCSLNSNSPNCECPNGYTGRFCERAGSAKWIDNVKRSSFKLYKCSVVKSSRDALVTLLHSRKGGGVCALNPCGAHGYCFELTSEAYTCECDPGWVQDAQLPQPNCRMTSSFDCVLSNCENGGRCPIGTSRSSVEEIQSKGSVVSCICPKDTSGHFCEISDRPNNGTSRTGGRSPKNRKFLVVLLAILFVASVISVIVVTVWKCKSRASKKVSSKPKDPKRMKLKKLNKKLSDTLEKLKKRVSQELEKSRKGKKGGKKPKKGKKGGKKPKKAKKEKNQKKGKKGLYKLKKKEKKRNKGKKAGELTQEDAERLERGEFLRQIAASSEFKVPSSDSRDDWSK